MRLRLSLAVIVLAVSLVGGLGFALAGPAAPVTSNKIALTQTQRCTRESLTIKAGETEAAMGGVRQTPFVITNVSKSACTLAGYPALELLSKAGAVVKRATKQKSDEPIKAASLEPGKTAEFGLNYNAGGAGYMGKPCPSYKRIRVTLPGVIGPFLVISDVQTCAKTDFAVTPITTGTPE